MKGQNDFIEFTIETPNNVNTGERVTGGGYL